MTGGYNLQIQQYNVTFRGFLLKKEFGKCKISSVDAPFSKVF